MGDERKRATLHNKLKQYLADVDAHRTTPVTYISAVEWLTRVGEIWTKLEKIQETLENTAADDDAFSVQVIAGGQCEKTFTNVRGKLRYLVDALKPKPSHSGGGSGAGGTPGGGSGSGGAPIQPSIKLPVISLPTFDGCYSDWLSFKDLFAAAIDNNMELSNSQRLQYLKTSLRGEPSNLIGYLTTTDANYTEAMKILNDRYDNKKEIIRSHVTQLLDLKSVKSENARELQLLVDSSIKCLRSLTVLGCPTNQWDNLTVVIVERKLDPSTRREWAKQQIGSSPTTFEDLIGFLNSYIRGPQAAGYSSSTQPGEKRSERQFKVNHTGMESTNCVNCKGNHQIHECKEFMEATPVQRSSMAKKARVCFNCLKADHIIKNCTSTRKCKKCGSRHHTFLHEERKTDKIAEKAPTVQGNHVAIDTSKLLKTALVHIKDKYGVQQPCRVFLDGGSQGDFITVSCADRLGLQRHAGCVRVSGVGGKEVGMSKGKVRTTLFNRLGKEKFLEVELHVMNKLTGLLPSVPCVKGTWQHLQGIHLADPNWHQPGNIDIMLGVKYEHKYMLHDRRMGRGDNDPVAWNTIFGYVVSGTCPIKEDHISSNHVSVDPIAQQLQRFWEMEEPPRQRIITREEKLCEEHFVSTYSRDSKGRYVVAVPFDEDKR